MYLLKHPACLFIIDTPGIRQTLSPGIALHQPCAKLLLQRTDVFPHHHRRQTQLTCRPGETAAIRNGNEHFHTAQLIHIANPQLVIN